MVKDRLSELRRKGGVQDSVDGAVDFTEVDIEKGNASANEPLLGQSGKSIGDYLTLFSSIRADIDRLVKDKEEVRKLHTKLLTTPGADQELSSDLNSIVDSFTVSAKKVRVLLQELDDEVREIEKKEKDNSHATDNRIKKNQVMTLIKALGAVVTEFNTEQVEYKEKCKKNIDTYLKIQGVNLPEEDIAEAIDNGDFSEKMKGLVLATAQKKALYADVKSRTVELKKLEKNIRELAEMFHDLHLLVVSQGELLDHIEMNIQQATDYAERARDNVTGARQLQKKARKWKFIICIATVILVLILFFIIQSMVCMYTPIC